MEMFWEDDPVQLDTGRDQRIADGLEVAALSDGDDGYLSEEGSDQEIDYYNPQTKDFAAGRKRRKLRVAGGVAPTAKPVTANYDSDDGRIIELKQLGYSDEYVAAKLIEEGRIRYVGKTIGSRYLRLRKVLDDKEDDKLDDELTDWHEGEDDKLVPIVRVMEKKLNRQIEALKVRMWKDVSSFFAGQIGGNKKYTHKACRQRYEAVLAGTELLPIELDSDKEGRRKMREERIKAAKAARITAAADAVELEARKKAKTTERKRAIAEANQKKVAFQLKKIAEKKERLRIRDERNANRELAKKTRLHTLYQMRIERDWEMEKNRREKEIYKKIMGVDLNGKPTNRPGNKGKNSYDSDEESEPIDDLESDEDDANFTDAEEADDADDESENENVDPELEHPTINDGSIIVDSPAPAIVKLPSTSHSGRKRKLADTDVLANRTEDSSPTNKKISPASKGSTPKRKLHIKNKPVNADPSSTPPSKKGTPAKKKPSPKSAPAVPFNSNALVAVTEDTLFNPRSVMTRSELDMVCFTRNIPRRPASEESQPELVARMNAVDESLNRQELDDLLRQATESTAGNRLSKIERLQKSEAAKSIAGGMGLDAHDLDHMRRYEGFTAGEFKHLLDDAEHAAARHLPGVAGKSTTEVAAYADW